MNQRQQKKWKRRGLYLSLLILDIYLAFIGFTGPSHAGEPTKAPQLRIETEMHTAPIWRMDVDANERYLVTGSDDKTVRVWSLDDGRLLQVLRLPLDEGNEGKVYAVAISPDGETIAAGGWTGLAGENKSIYLFERQSGRLKRRLKVLPNVINHLSYSPDGHRLVATLGNNNGIRVWNTRDYEQIGEDKAYGDGSYWADFDSDGRLVTSSYDGYIRLYDASLRLLTKREAPGGKQPFAVAFSPDGRRVAVGYINSTTVNVLSGLDLELDYTPDTTGISNGNLGSVSWSQDGALLYAGGTYGDNSVTSIIRWSNAGRGKRQTLSAGLTTLMALQPLSENRLAWASQDPAFGLLDSEGQNLYTHLPEIADFRIQDNQFLVSAEGATLQFSYKLWGKEPARFSLLQRSLEVGITPGFNPVAEAQKRLTALGFDPGPVDGEQGPRTRDAIRSFQRQHNLPMDGEVSTGLLKQMGGVELKAPRTRAPGLELTDWKHKYEPRLNGEALPLEKYETSRSLAITPDGSHFLLGTEWNLRLFSRQGKEVWKKPSPGVAWAVNISADGRLALVAFIDGTIRWYRLEDGEPLLNFFPHQDGKRWVAWTPEGYYMAAPGAENLIGWHLNKGKDKTPEFYGASRFRKQFYRPDVIARVLSTLDVQLALKQADHLRGTQTLTRDVRELRPPIVSILSPAAGITHSSKRLALTYKSRSETGPILEVEVKIDGRPIKPIKHSQDFAEQKQFVVGEVELELPSRDSMISLIARNKHGSSEAAHYVVNWSGAKDWYKPKLYVLAVGVSNYQDTSYKLNYAAKDAEDFGREIKAQEGGLYSKVTVRVLPDKKANKAEILDGLEWLEKNTTPRDVAMLFLSGHGKNDAKGKYRFLPHDYNRLREKRSTISGSEITDFLGSVPGKVVALLDTCYSGGAAGAKGDQQPDVDRLANELADADHGVIVFSSSTGKQFSLEDPLWNNGAFTKALIEGIRGQADYKKDWFISMAELELYLGERVKELTNGRQTPVTTQPDGIPDFKMVKVKQKN